MGSSSQTVENDVAASYEDAISATKFGKFNIILMLVSIPAAWSSSFELTTMSYVFPAAQCDLDLSLYDKGLLNAVTFIGMVTTGFFWGYFCDALGRRRLLCIGCFVDSLLVIGSSLSQTYTTLVIIKFFGGIIVNGPFAALTTYHSEVHCSKHRSKVQMTLGSVYTIGAVFLTILAKFILQCDVNFTILDSLKIHPWNILLLLTAALPLLATLGFYFLPETPKFLMSKGRNKEALEAFQFIYSLNTGKPKDTYPITALIIEDGRNQFGSRSQLETIKRSTRKALLHELSALKTLFFPPFIRNLLLACNLQTVILISLNSLKLWIPQLFQAVTDYQYYNNGTSANLCTMLEVIRPSGDTNSTECFVNTDNTQVYVNTVIISSVTLVGTATAGFLINIIGKKNLLYIVGTVSGLCSYGLYFATSEVMTLVLCSIYIAMTTVGFNVSLIIIVDLFPTNLRTTTISIAMTLARFGSVVGNILFPVLLKTGCAGPFFALGTVALSSIFFTIFLPNTEMKPLL